MLLFFDKCISIILNSFHLFLIFSRFVYILLWVFLNKVFFTTSKIYDLLILNLKTTKYSQHIPLSAYHLNSDTNYWQWSCLLHTFQPPSNSKREVFFSISCFFYEHSRFIGQQGKGEAISLTPLFHFHPPHIHLEISRVISAESSLLHITSNQTQTGNIWFPSAKLLTTKLSALNGRLIMNPENFRF